jgi:hypothetical protein
VGRMIAYAVGELVYTPCRYRDSFLPVTSRAVVRAHSALYPVATGAFAFTRCQSMKLVA